MDVACYSTTAGNWRLSVHVNTCCIAKTRASHAPPSPIRIKLWPPAPAAHGRGPASARGSQALSAAAAGWPHTSTQLKRGLSLALGLECGIERHVKLLRSAVDRILIVIRAPSGAGGGQRALDRRRVKLVERRSLEHADVGHAVCVHKGKASADEEL